MKKTYLLLCLLFVFGISVKTSAQVAPPEVNLIHQWTFDDGTVNDSKGTLNGTIEGAATVTNNALNTTAGGYVTLPGADLAINTYTELSVEVWFTSAKNANTSFHMLYYFGDTNANGGGIDYTCVTPARGNNVSRAMISTGEGGNNNENGIDGPEYDDGLLHHMVCVITGYDTGNNITFYIDGVNIGAQDLTGTNSLGMLSNSLAYFAKGGYRSDPTWKGLMHKISIYNVALTDDNVLYLFQHGAEDKQVITIGDPKLVFDTNFESPHTTVTGANLSFPISITTPAGITAQYQNVTVTSLPANVVNADVAFVYDGLAPVDGVITLTSGSTTNSILVKAVSDANCFAPLYNGEVGNLIHDAGMNSLSQFAGWGTREIVSLFNNPEQVYCGASSIKVGDGINGGSGSLDFHPGILDEFNSGLLAPNTTYRLRVMAKTDGVFRVGIERIDINNPANNNVFHEFNTNGEWKPIDLYFVTGDFNYDNPPVIYINDWSLDGKVAFVDNWEIYPTVDLAITADRTSFSLDPQYTTGTFSVNGGNLTEDIIINAPAGITVDPAVLPANSISAPVTVTYDGTTAVNGDITLTSGTASTKILVKTAGSNADCFTPLYTDRQNLIPDPYFNDQSKFAGWQHGSGTWGLINTINNTDSVYCGSHSAKLFVSADIEVPLPGVLTPNSSYIAKAMVRTIGGYFHMGINGYDTALTGDLVDSINTEGVWQQMTFEFNTGIELAERPVIFFNNDGNTGRVAYLDNWELYKKDTISAVVPVKDLFENLYVQNGRIVAEFALDHASTAQLTIYTVQGAMVSDEKIAGVAGSNRKVGNAILPGGMYLVKLTKNGETSFRKLIK